MPRVLVVEDNDDNRNLIERYLQLFQFEVLTATDGASGLDRATTEAEQIDLILLDMNLPVMDGWEVATRLKANAVTRDVPIIAVTAHAMVGDREKTLAAGCDDFATKPIDFSALLGQMQTLLSKTAAV
jgi:CheY-like chemotaxis protein